METLSPLGPVFHAGTLSGNPLATAAGLAALDQLVPDVYIELLARARHLAAVLRDACAAAGFPARFPVVGTLVGMVCGDVPEPVDFDGARRTDEAAYGAFFQAMLAEGVAMAPGAYEAIFVGLGHDDAVLDEIAERAAAPPAPRPPPSSPPDAAGALASRSGQPGLPGVLGECASSVEAMRQVISWRFVATHRRARGPGAVRLRGVRRSRTRSPRSSSRPTRRPGGWTSSPSSWRTAATGSRSRRRASPRVTCTMSAGAGGAHGTGLRRHARARSRAPTSTSRACCWPRRSATRSRGSPSSRCCPNFQFELPAIESLDGGYANLVNGWQLPYAPVIDRSRCEEKYPAESFSEFLRLAGEDHRAIYSFGRGEITHVACWLSLCWTRVPRVGTPALPTLRCAGRRAPGQRFGRAIRSAMSSGSPYGRDRSWSRAASRVVVEPVAQQPLDDAVGAGELAAISAASASTVASSSSSGTARSTSPMASAAAASIRRLVNISSLAAASADPLGQPDRHPPHRHQAPLAVGVAERGRRRRDEQVAGQRQLEATGEAVAAELGDRRLRQALEGVDGLGGEVRRLVALALGDRAEVVAGAERAPGAGEHDTADRRRRPPRRRARRAGRRTSPG